MVDCEIFRTVCGGATSQPSWQGLGCPPVDPVLMFKILVLEALYSLSDEATEFQIKDRSRSSAFSVLVSTAQCRMQRRFGCSASAW